ncbi:MAG: hypothetical protein LBD30_07590 [Verrucomicrobiales bacterium]|jgi:hypothetical protein|nr:hypothetical protein [Verrucomicrobiales bacterium]
MLGKLNPIQIFTNNRLAAWFWFAVSVLVLGYALVLQPFLLVTAMRTKEKVLVVNNDTGTMIYAPVLGFLQADELHAYHARMAIFAICQKSPNGYAFPELVNRLFVETCRKKLLEQWETDKPQFQAQQIRQTPEIAKITIVSTGLRDGFDSVTVNVSGQVVRTGVSAGVPFADPHPFAAQFVFIRNPDILENALMPEVVATFTYKEQ